MPADEGYHRFSMLERVIRNLAKRGSFDEALRIYRELLATDFGAPRYSKLKVRFAADLAKQALVQQKREVAEEVLAAAEAALPAADLDASDRELVARVRADLGSL